MTVEPAAGVSFAITINGSSSGELRPDYANSLSRPLHRMDSVRPFALAVWSYPSALDFEDTYRSDYTAWYLQCAGSADGMTIELREPTKTVHDRSDVNQWVIGKHDDQPETEPSVEIRWGEHSTLVTESEVFTAGEALDVFIEYVRTASLPGSWHKRLIDSRQLP